MAGPIFLDRAGVELYQRNRDPYLMIDEAEEVVPGVSAKGYKNLIENLWFFQVHWPGDPNMPGMLQVEALVQLAALTVLTLPGNAGKLVYLLSADRIKLTKKVTPGGRLDLTTTLLTWKRGIGTCRGEGFVQGDRACQAEFTIMMPSVVSQYRVVTPPHDTCP